MLINKDDIQKKLPKSFTFFNLKDFTFYKYICEVYILADIKRNIKIKIYIGTKTTFDFSDTKKFLFYNVKDFIFYKFICEIYILADIK